jgi:hypothetical protein
MKHMNEPVPRLRDRRPDVPESFATIIHRALEKDPARRFASAAEMHQAIAGTGLGSGPAVDLAAAPTVQVQGTAPMAARTQTQQLDRPARAAPAATGRILTALSVVLIVAAAVWLTAMYFQGRQPEARNNSFPTPAATLDESTEEPSATPSPSIPPTPTNITPGGGVGGPLDLPGFGNNNPGRSRDRD